MRYMYLQITRTLIITFVAISTWATNGFAQSPDGTTTEATPKTLKNPFPYAENTVRAGQKIYTRQCITCHGKDGKGKTDKVTDMPIKPVDFTLGKFKFGNSDGELFTVIKHGTKGGMLPFAAILKDPQLWHLVNYVRSLGPKKDGIPIIDIEDAVPENPLEANYDALSRGKRFYSMHCVKCHGENGMGDTEMREFLETHPSDLTNGEWKYGARDGDIFNAIKNGAGNDMPPFETKLNDERIWQVVIYLRSMNKKK
jgi:mono/diheme cytochrome c family protein